LPPPPQRSVVRGSTHDWLTDKIIRKIKWYAHQLDIFYGVPGVITHISDIDQDLFCEVLKAFEKYDPSKSNPNSFCELVLRRYKKRYITSKLLTKRGRGFYNVGEETLYLLESSDTTSQPQIDTKTIIESMTLLNQVIVALLQNHSALETSKLLNVSYGYLNTLLKKIRKEITNKSTNMGEKMQLQREKLQEYLTAHQISELPINDLMQLSVLINERFAEAKNMKEKFETGLHLRFSEVLHKEMLDKSKDTGTVHFLENNFKITAEVPKKVTWDNEEMERVMKFLPESQRDKIVKTSYTVDERLYLTLPEVYKRVLASARTVTPGKVRYKISLENQ
jgi:hypothetical protein